MALQITIARANIREYHVNIDGERVDVTYLLEEADGSYVRSESCTFWVTLPSNPTQNDYQLPANYVTELLALRANAKTAIETRLGIA